MFRVSEIIDEALGQSFEIQCSSIKLRGRDDSVPPYFQGPGSISGGVAGPFVLHLHNTLAKDGRELITMHKAIRSGSLSMCCDAVDYRGRKWTGGWLSPTIIGSSASNCYVTGNFPQLSTDTTLEHELNFKNSTIIYYAGDLRLPMLELTHLHGIRDEIVTYSQTHWDRTQLEFDGASVQIETDQDGRTILRTSYSGEWQPPYCEVGLADSIGFACAIPARPRITVRGFDDRAIVFLRDTLSEPRTGLPRPVAYHGPKDKAFWTLFLAFLHDCRVKKEFESTRLSRLFTELTFASTGTVHALMLSLVVAVDDLVEQILGRGSLLPDLDELKRHVQAWQGNPELRESAVRVLSSALSRTSTPQHLTRLEANGVVTSEQIELWKNLRPRLAHGKVSEYGDELWQNRNQLINMVYRLAARVLNYKGRLTDYGQNPPSEFDFQWIS